MAGKQEKFPVSAEDAYLKAKFRSLAFTSPHRDQRRSECDQKKQDEMKARSYELWKKLNPGYYVEEDPKTETRESQQYEQRDFVIRDKSYNRRRDQHTAFVNSVAMSRGGK